MLNLPLEATSYKQVITGILTARKPAKLTGNLLTNSQVICLGLHEKSPSRNLARHEIPVYENPVFQALKLGTENYMAISGEEFPSHRAAQSEASVLT